MFYFDDASWPSTKIGDVRVVSPPNYDCFFNSLLAFVRLFTVISQVVEVKNENVDSEDDGTDMFAERKMNKD